MIEDAAINEAAELFCSDRLVRSCKNCDPIFRALSLRETRQSKGRIDLAGAHIRLTVHRDGDLISRIVCHLAVHEMAEPYDPGIWETACEQASGEFAQVMESMNARLGEALFGEESANHAEAFHLARWKRKHGELLLQARHDDKELPVCVLLMFLPIGVE